MLPKLPATASGICLARIAVAACSREDPCVRLEFAFYNEVITGRTHTAEVEPGDQDIIRLGNRPNSGS